MAELQRLTGIRPGEACRMTTGQIDRSCDPWLYQPARHKTDDLGKHREIAERRAGGRKIISKRLALLMDQVREATGRSLPERMSTDTIDKIMNDLSRKYPTFPGRDDGGGPSQQRLRVVPAQGGVAQPV